MFICAISTEVMLDTLLWAAPLASDSFIAAARLLAALSYALVIDHQSFASRLGTRRWLMRHRRPPTAAPAHAYITHT
jgi:hypothetical protein